MAAEEPKEKKAVEGKGQGSSASAPLKDRQAFFFPYSLLCLLY